MESFGVKKTRVHALGSPEMSGVAAIIVLFLGISEGYFSFLFAGSTDRTAASLRLRSTFQLSSECSATLSSVSRKSSSKL